MNKIYSIILIAVVSLWSCGSPQKETTNDTQQTSVATPGVSETPLNETDKVGAWKQASDSQKLNLSERYTANANKEPGSKIGSMDMNNCLEEAIRGLESTNELTISEVASACVVMIRQMNFEKK